MLASRWSKFHWACREKTYGMKWYSNMINFLSELNDANNLHIVCSSEKVFIYTCTLKLLFFTMPLSIWFGGYCEYNPKWCWPFSVFFVVNFFEALIIPNELRKVYPSPLPDLKDLKVKTASKKGDVQEVITLDFTFC